MADSRVPTASFIVEHDDPAMGMRKQYVLSFYESDGTLQMYDVHLKRMFLKRTVPPERSRLSDFYIGALIVVCARPLRVLDYGDDLTRRRYASVRGVALMLIKPDAYHAAGKIIDMVYSAGLTIGRLRMSRFTEEDAAAFLQTGPAASSAAAAAPVSAGGAGGAGGRPASSASTSALAAAGSALLGGSHAGGAAGGAGAGAGGGFSAAASAEAVAHLSCDAVVAVEVTGDDVMSRLHALVGPAHPADAADLAPVSVRAVFGKDRIRNAVHVSRDVDAARAELAFAFDRKAPHTGALQAHASGCRAAVRLARFLLGSRLHSLAVHSSHSPSTLSLCSYLPLCPSAGVYTHCSVCLIKPHAVAERHVGKVWDALLAAGLEVSAARSLVLNASDAIDYLDAYRGVCPEYERWVTELSSGPAVVLEVRGDDVVPDLRALAGPYDPEIARALRPGTLRARFGVNAVKNAVHVTDVEVDGPLESKFFFVVLE